VPKKKKGRVVKPGMEEQVIDALKQKLQKKLDESMNTSQLNESSYSYYPDQSFTSQH